MIYIETGDDKTVLQCAVGDIFIPDLHLDTIKVKTRDFR
ncbi:hypothetical protein ACSSVZ_005479 [Amorphus sp. MBR-141]